MVEAIFILFPTHIKKPQKGKKRGNFLENCSLNSNNKAILFLTLKIFSVSIAHYFVFISQNREVGWGRSNYGFIVLPKIKPLDGKVIKSAESAVTFLQLPSYARFSTMLVLIYTPCSDLLKLFKASLVLYTTT